MSRLMIFASLVLLSGHVHTSNQGLTSESETASLSSSYFVIETENSSNVSPTPDVTENFVNVGNVTGTETSHGRADSVDLKTQQRGMETTVSSVFDFTTKPPTTPNYLTEFYIDTHLLTEEVFVSSNQVADDVSSCQPCRCSYSHSGHLMANCSNGRLTAVPANLPKDTWSIDLCHNDLKEFNISSVSLYPSLTRLRISNNRMLTKVLRGDASKTAVSLTHLDLSNNSLNFIEDASFSTLTKLSNLTLRGNNITKITNKTFVGLEQLVILDLSDGTYKFETGAFDALINLKLLDLSCVWHLGYGVKFLPPRLLQPLTALRYFYIQGSSRPDEAQLYPSKSLKQLTSLRGLSLDGMRDNHTFGVDVRSLKNFTHLQIGFARRCLMKNLTRDFFSNIPYITSFEITSCPLSNISQDAFADVNLTRLSLSYLDNYDIFRAFEELQQFENSSLRNLSFIHLYHQGPPCTYLSATQATYLRHIDLEELDLSSNRLALLGQDFIKLLPKTLKRLILRDNRFVSRTLTISSFLPLNRLLELDVSYQNTDVLGKSDTCQRSLVHEQTGSVHIADDFYSGFSEATKYDSVSKSVYAETVQSLKYATMGNQNISNFSTHPAETKQKIDKTRLKLKIVHSAYFNSFGLSLIRGTFVKETSVEEIDLSYNFLSSWGLDKLPLSVRKADFRGNYCQQISKNFFPTRNELLSLDVRENFLGPGFANDVDGTMFAKLNRLVYLDIRHNLIYELPFQFFKGLQQIRTLKISDNKLGYLNSNFSHMRDLSFLDVSRNSISSISAVVRDHLDSIASSHTLYVDLSLNPLPCTCAMIDVLYWMTHTKVVFVNKSFLKCRYETGQIVAIGDIESRLSELQKSCASLTLVIAISLCCLAVIGVIVTTAMMYRYRWKLRYLRAVAFAKIVGFTPTVPVNSKYKFDAYILYTEETRDFVIEECTRELEEKRGHKLCFEERNFMPGSLIVSDIVSAVRNSTKTVPVVTPGFYRGKYSEYGVNMAFMEEAHEQRSVVHLCVYHASPVDDMHCDLLMVMKRKTYTEYPPLDQASEDLVKLFWDELSQAIGHTDMNTNVCEQIH